MIPFSPPRIDQKIIDEVVDTLKSGWITTGPKTNLFEEKIAEYCGVESSICLNSATAGMHLALHWWGVKAGDEVIVPAYTYCATANIVQHLGATVVFCDVNQDDFNLNPDLLEGLITEKTKAILPVDISGLPADYERIYKAIEAKRELFQPETEEQKKLGRILLLSDAAHSIGALSKNLRTGKLADLSSFSFHAVKNLTTAEGGALCFNLPSPFNNLELRKYFKTKSLHGQSKDALSKMKAGAWQYDVIEAGFKCNMTDINAAIGLVELERYEDTLAKRKTIFEFYDRELSEHDWAITPISKDAERESSYHLYLLRIKDCSEEKRNQIIQIISENQVAVNVHYLPVPGMTHYKNLGYSLEDYPVAHSNYKNEISLPVFYDLSPAQMETVVSVLINAVHQVL
jgi:dTDP-4-amino-4,6-dideoxygalactose transaminase